MRVSTHFKTCVYGAAMRGRLKKADWLRLGLRMLASEGPGALKAASLAAKLGISRGSFYWHFRDIADFKSQLLASWRARSTDRVIRDLDARRAEPDRLNDLLRRALGAKRDRLEEAVRRWAAEDNAVARAVAANDARRIAYIVRLLTESGAPSETARGRATFLYWAYLGQAIVATPRHGAISDAAIADVSDLFERRSGS